MGIDITGSKPCVLPQSHATMDAAEVSASLEELFLETQEVTGYLIPIEELFQRYTNYCVEHSLPKCRSSAALWKRLLNYKHLVEKMHTRTGNSYQIRR